MPSLTVTLINADTDQTVGTVSLFSIPPEMSFLQLTCKGDKTRLYRVGCATYHVELGANPEENSDVELDLYPIGNYDDNN